MHNKGIPNILTSLGPINIKFWLKRPFKVAYSLFSVIDARFAKAQDGSPLVMHKLYSMKNDFFSQRSPLTQRQLAQNTLLQNKSGVQLYQLMSGELEIVATTREPDKLYKFILGGC